MGATSPYQHSAALTLQLCARRRLITPYFGISVSCYEPPKTVNISHRDVVVPRVRWAGCLENMTMALTIGFLRRIWPNKIQQ